MWSESTFAALDLRGMGRYDLAFAKNSLTILVKAFQKIFEAGMFIKTISTPLKYSVKYYKIKAKF